MQTLEDAAQPNNAPVHASERGFEQESWCVVVFSDSTSFVH
jgi:hypothetical protein